jgi:arsenite methyltransferase
MKAEDLKLVVKEKYGEIARSHNSPGDLKSPGEYSSSCCCGPSCCGTEVDYTLFSENYQDLKGYNPDADLGLGCGIPTEFAKINPGDTVIDLGSGAGNDCFVARALTAEHGRVIGIDMTEEMIEKARSNTLKLGFSNVEFRLGDIENMPVVDNTADVVISNCVLNLVPDKKKAFAEIFRILKPGGHLSVSDIVIKGELPVEVKEAAEMYAGCVSGAIQMDEYLDIIKNAGLKNVTIQKERQDILPDDLLLDYITPEQLATFKKSGFGIFSITIYAEK